MTIRNLRAHARGTTIFLLEHRRVSRRLGTRVGAAATIFQKAYPLSFRVRAREDFESSFVASRLARPLSRARHV